MPIFPSIAAMFIIPFIFANSVDVIRNANTIRLATYIASGISICLMWTPIWWICYPVIVNAFALIVMASSRINLYISTKNFVGLVISMFICLVINIILFITLLSHIMSFNIACAITFSMIITASLNVCVHII